RYLAAAAYTDKSFRDKAIELVETECRAQAPELAIDADIVLHHCRLARRREALRDAALCVVPVLIAATGVVGALLQTPWAYQQIPAYYTLPLLGIWAIAAAILFIERVLTQHVTLTRRLSAGRFDPVREPAAARAAQNVVVHGGFSPFVGSGYDI